MRENAQQFHYEIRRPINTNSKEDHHSLPVNTKIGRSKHLIILTKLLLLVSRL